LRRAATSEIDTSTAAVEEVSRRLEQVADRS
jgi:hypothetical protein